MTPIIEGTSKMMLHKVFYPNSLAVIGVSERPDNLAFRVAPRRRGDAERMLGELRARAVLEGARGHAPVDREAIVTALLALSRLVTENPGVLEVEVNPLLVWTHGAAAVDARAVVLAGSGIRTGRKQVR